MAGLCFPPTFLSSGDYVFLFSVKTFFFLNQVLGLNNIGFRNCLFLFYIFTSILRLCTTPTEYKSTLFFSNSFWFKCTMLPCALVCQVSSSVNSEPSLLTFSLNKRAALISVCARLNLHTSVLQTEKSFDQAVHS